MNIMDIKTVPNKILRKKSRRIERIDKSIKKLIKDMTNTLRDVGGLGIAAPQVGELSNIIIVESVGGKRKDGQEKPIIPLTILINLAIVESSKETKIDE